MTTHYKLLIETETEPTSWIQVEIAGDATLHDLHGAIERNFALAPSENYAFFRSGIVNDRRTQFSGDGLESEYYADETPLERLALRVGTKMAYVANVDLDEAFALRVESIEAATTKLDAPRLLARGEKPADAREALRRDLVRRLDVELVQDGDPEDDAQASSARLAVLARDIYAFVDGDRERLAALSNAGAIDVESWLLDLPTFLAAQQRVDEALELSERGGALFAPLIFAADRAQILARAGRPAEARVLTRRVVTEVLEHKEDRWALIQASEVLREIGDSVEAEAILRTVLETSQDDPMMNDDARDALAAMLDQQGRGDEAELLRSASVESANEEYARENARRDAAIADVGRNDPCPCGSEKKFKKCCGAPGAMPPRTDVDCVSDLFVEMFEFVCKSAYLAEFDEAIPRFAGPEFRGLSLHDTVPLMPTDDAFEALLWWFVFDRTLADGNTPAARFLEKRGRSLSSAQRSALDGMRRSHLSVVRYSVGGDHEGRLEDVLTGEVTLFPEVLPLESPSTGAVFVVRILHLSAGPVLAPTVLFTSKAAGAEFETRLRAHFLALRGLHPTATIPELLKSYGERVYRDWSDVATADAAKEAISS
jgi:hypothetical protein